MPVRGYSLLGRALARQGVDTMFYLMGGPMLDAAKAVCEEDIRAVDVRHEQAAAMMAQAYSRVRARPGVCMACSGPGAINLTTGLANALIDCAPVVALGGSSPVRQYGLGAFQEIDQVAIMRPVTKWAERVYDPKRIPEYVDKAFRQALSGKPGPVYLDLPGDILYQEVAEEDVVWPRSPDQIVAYRPAAPAEAIRRVIDLIGHARRPVLITGTGIVWSGASAELRDFVEMTGIPFYTTPQGRGVVPEDSEHFFAHARSTAMKEADLVIVVGTRLNFVFGFGRPPRFSPSATIVRIDIDPAEIGTSERVDVGIVGDAKTVLSQLCEALRGSDRPSRIDEWTQQLEAIERDRRVRHEAELATDQIPIHPLRLCKELRDFMDRDAILVVDGQEILNYGRQSLPSFLPGHRLNSGPFGTMGVGLPFGIGAKVARPDKQVVVLHGDGSFGMNGIELDTAVRHKIPVLVVISLNGGWTADPDRKKPGRDLGYTRYDEIAKVLGCHGEYVEHPEDIRSALERAGQAVAAGKVAVVNVVTDWRARAQTARFSAYAT